jgi:hypothetical protein
VGNCETTKVNYLNQKEENNKNLEEIRKEQLHILNFSPCLLGKQIKLDGIGGICSSYRRVIIAYEMLVGKPQVNISLGRPRHRWKDNIKRDLTEIR